MIAAHGRRGLLEVRDGRSLPYVLPGRGLAAVCGDRLACELVDGRAICRAVLPRTSELRRQPAAGGRTEVIAANLTHLAVVIATEPEPDLELVDRYLCAAELMPCAAAVVNGKADLGTVTGEALEAWRRIGYPVLTVSARRGSGVAGLDRWLSGGIGILVGQSGVGKSSLLNTLVPEAGLATGEISGSTGLGRHTTTASVMHRLPGGGRLIDTPGVRGFIPALQDPVRLRDGFREMAALAPRCHFADCSHRHEPRCAVLAALENGEVTRRRYASYRAMLAAVERLSASARPR